TRPFFLPDGRHFIFSGGPGFPPGLYLSDVDKGGRTKLRDAGEEPRYVSGHLLFILKNDLVALPFDLGAFMLSGTPVTLANNVANAVSVGTNFSVTEGGLLAFHQRSDATMDLVWYARDGRSRTERDATANWRNPALSPDDAQIAVERSQGKDPADIW